MRGLLILLLACTPLFGADFFKDISFDEALKRANEQEKMVFVDFYTTWCGPCKMLDRITWKDKSVINWLEEHTIPLKIDAERQVKLANRYNVNSYPNLVFINADGNIRDRIPGFVDGKRFLTEAERILSNEDPLENFRKKIAAGQGDDPQLRVEYARKLAMQCNHAEALKQYFWVYDNSRDVPGFGGVRNSYLLMDIVRLGMVYPPGLQSLRERRDQLEKEITVKLEENDTDRDKIADLIAQNRTLREDVRSLALYEKIRDKPDHPAHGTLLRASVDQLREAKRYAEIAEHMNLVKEVRKTLQYAELFSLELDEFPEEQRDQIQESQRSFTITKLAEIYQVMLGNGDTGEELVKQTLAFHDGAETYNALAWHAYLSGKAGDAHVEMARTALEKAGGNDPSIVDTLARLLSQTGKHQEGIDLVSKALDQAAPGRDYKILSDCLRDLQNQTN
jgi:thioredoxin-related protein